MVKKEKDNREERKSFIRKIPGFRSGKKWKMALASLFYLMIIIIIIKGIFAGEDYGSTPNPTIINTSTKTILTAWRDNIPTEYYLGNIKEKSITVEGFVEGSSIGMTRSIGGVSKESGIATVYRFSEASYAEIYFTNKTNEIKSRRGYSELSTSGLNSKCFGIEMSSLGAEMKEIMCVKNNIFFDIKFAGLTTPYEWEIKDLMKSLERTII